MFFAHFLNNTPQQKKIEEKPKHDPLTSLIKKFVRYAVFLNESK